MQAEKMNKINILGMQIQKTSVDLEEGSILSHLPISYRKQTLTINKIHVIYHIKSIIAWSLRSKGH